MLSSFNEFTKMYIPRYIKDSISVNAKSNKVLVVLGARRVGKTELLKTLASTFQGKHLLLNGEDLDTHELVNSRRVSSYNQWVKEVDLLMIDEAQAIPEVGKSLKLLIDTYKELTIIITGSSAFDLSNMLGEPLVGRQKIFHLFPISQLELSEIEGFIDTKSLLPQRLVYGGYPDVVLFKTNQERKDYLKGLVSSYLLKDILIYEQVKNADKMLKLLSLLAFQVGSEVSYNELSNALQIDRNTVERYLDLFSKVFIIFKVGGFSRNLRKEVTKSSKWYFYDNGLRNALIDDFRPMEVRQDIGALWENYLISERIKRNHYTGQNKQGFFWRTYDQQEIDWLEIEDTNISSYEIKWKKGTVKVPKAFAKSYPDATFEVINRESYLGFIK